MSRYVWYDGSMNRKCTKCGETMSNKSFYFRPNGHAIQPCKRCAYAAVRAWQAKNPEKHAEQKRRFAKANPESMRRSVAKSRAKDPSKHAATNRAWFERNRKRVYAANRAGRLVRKAIESGELRRAKTCEACGRTGCKIEAAHRDYLKPLDVKWLCVSCHRRWDKESPKTKGEGMCGA